EVARKAGVRGARMSIARVTEPNAKFWGVPIGAWREEVYAASLNDPSKLRADADRIRRAFENGRELRLRHPNGTDLTLGLAHRPVQVTLGMVTPEGRKTPFGSMINVPDGTVYVSVDESTADGTFVANLPTTTNAHRLEGGRFTFEDGHLTGHRFRKGAATFGADYKAAGAGRDRPSFIEVGLDPSARRAPGIEEVVRGAVTVGIGGNAGFGGKTKLDFLSYLTVAGGELSVDGRPLVRGGQVVRR
ncbi:MAG TPA: aminopeptidase, partial [Thermoplasmata archaeon]|nr:aminopeptidase [Thermoplasmata archaeon]